MPQQVCHERPEQFGVPSAQPARGDEVQYLAQIRIPLVVIVRTIAPRFQFLDLFSRQTEPGPPCSACSARGSWAFP